VAPKATQRLPEKADGPQAVEVQPYRALPAPSLGEIPIGPVLQELVVAAVDHEQIGFVGSLGYLGDQIEHPVAGVRDAAGIDYLEIKIRPRGVEYDLQPSRVGGLPAVGTTVGR